MSLESLFDFFWRDYAGLTPDALKINAMLEERGERFFNDHVAFRTFNLDPIGLESLAATFLALGYQQSGEYRFEEKKLRARSYSHPDPHAPHVFISELLTGEFSPELQEIVRGLVGQVPAGRKNSPELFTALPSWKPVSYSTYQKLLSESEYAGWLAAFGIRVNHFTVSINTLKTFDSIEQYNQWLLDAGFRLNESGGLVKGTPEELLEQSSTMANRIEWEFADGERHVIPSCYYEFARRYPDPQSGELYEGFIAKSADKIFESTNSNLSM
jgi:hypothetical protein